MTLLTVVQDVCATVGVAVPTSVFSNISSNRTMTEMLALANEAAQRIAYDLRDWTKLRLQATYTGDGVKTSFPFPADFKRMLLTSNVWRSTNATFPMMFVPDLDQWMNRRALNICNSGGEWTITGGNILIQPVLGVGETAYHGYLHKNCITLAGGGVGDKFMADGDNFGLDERVHKLAMIWQWKAQKGSPYQEDLGTYGDAVSYAMGHDSPAPIIIGRIPISVAAQTSYPYPTPSSASWSWPFR